MDDARVTAVDESSVDQRAEEQAAQEAGDDECTSQEFGRKFYNTIRQVERERRGLRSRLHSIAHDQDVVEQLLQCVMISSRNSTCTLLLHCLTPPTEGCRRMLRCLPTCAVAHGTSLHRGRDAQ